MDGIWHNGVQSILAEENDPTDPDSRVPCCIRVDWMSFGSAGAKVTSEHEWTCPFRSEARLHRELPQLLATPWYWNTRKRAVAEGILSTAEEGSFLVRRCGSLPDVEFVFSVKVQSGFEHYAILFCREMQRYYLKLRDSQGKHPSRAKRLLMDFVRMTAAQPSWFNLRQLSPKQRVPELKEFCRAVIRGAVSDSDDVECLPLSKPMKRYLVVTVETYTPSMAY